jgi:hypothetical protein
MHELLSMKRERAQGLWLEKSVKAWRWPCRP